MLCFSQCRCELTSRQSGLLSGHQYASKGDFQISWYKGELLKMAVDLGERLLPAFQTPTGLPYARVFTLVLLVPLQLLILTEAEPTQRRDAG
jgi:hypothetical protein